MYGKAIVLVDLRCEFLVCLDTVNGRSKNEGEHTHVE